jgi:hypothetical protein
MYGALTDSTGSVFCEDTTDVSRIFSGPLTYSKGMYLLHMLRWKLGDVAFFTAVYDYINDTSLCYGFARTEDLKQHLESVSGKTWMSFSMTGFMERALLLIISSGELRQTARWLFPFTRHRTIRLFHFLKCLFRYN